MLRCRNWRAQVCRCTRQGRGYILTTGSFSSHLDLRIGVHGRDGEPLVLAMVLGEVVLLQRHLPHDLVRLHGSVTVVQVEGKEAELPRDVELELLAEKGAVAARHKVKVLFGDSLE